MAKKNNKRWRLPNGIGSVHKINDGKRRRKPWRARVPSHVEFNENTGKATQKYITLGYYESEEEALDALFDFRKNPYTIEASSVTFTEVYEMWKAKKYPEISESGQRLYTAQYKNSSFIHNMKMREIRSLHLEQIMQNIKGGYKTQTAIKTFWGQVFKYAIEHDIIQKNYSEFVKTRDKDTGTTRSAIPDEDIAKIWNAIDEGDETAEVVMIYIYTGLRLNELLELPKENVNLEGRMMIGGKKTAAGKDRKIPIHKCILPFIEKRMQTNNEYLIEANGKPFKGQTFSKLYWSKLMDRLEIQDCTPHYARHTCATMLRVAGVEEDLRKLILGHASGDITDRYTHVPDSMLIEAIDKLPGRE